MSDADGESTSMKCPRCGTVLEDRKQSETVTVWDCPKLECKPHFGGLIR